MIESIENLDQLRKITNTDKRVLVLDFYAPWCTPCDLLTPLLQQMEKFYNNKCLVIRIDVYKYSSIADAFGITGMPTVMFFFGKKLWKELTVVGGDIGTIYQNVSILITQRNDGMLPVNEQLLYNPQSGLGYKPVF